MVELIGSRPRETVSFNMKLYVFVGFTARIFIDSMKSKNTKLKVTSIYNPTNTPNYANNRICTVK